MSPKLKISQELYSRLAARAKGFDTPEQVIERMLDGAGEVSGENRAPHQKSLVPRHERDYTKYSFSGNQYGKGRLVLAVVRDFVQQHDEISHGDLLSAWPEDLQGSLGVFKNINEPELDFRRYFNKISEQLVLSDTSVVVCNQWGRGNIDNFLRAAKDHGYEIAESEAPMETSTRENQMARKKTLRGLVIQMWTLAGEPQWDYSETRAACIEANAELQERGLNPAKKFREKVEDGDKAYIENWVTGCHFDWLNPRTGK